MIDKIDRDTEKYIINRFVSMPKLFDELGIDYNLHSNMLCPFHHNENTPAAKLYSDNDGYKLWCFSEGKMYGAWDVYKHYMEHINTNKLALKILNLFSVDDQKALLESVGIEFDTTQDITFIDALKEFKQGKIDVIKLKDLIASTYIDS